MHDNVREATSLTDYRPAGNWQLLSAELYLLLRCRTRRPRPDVVFMRQRTKRTLMDQSVG
jgi:hypothetical protein